MKSNELVKQVLQRCFEPKENLTPSQWAEKYISLSKKSSKIAGQFSLDATPYWRFPYEVYARPHVRKMVFQTGAQIAKTTFIANMMAERVVNGNEPIAYIGQNGKETQGFSEREFFPRMESCKPLHALIPKDDDKVKKKEIQFTNGVNCYFRSAGSARDLKGVPICYAFGDEVDSYEDLDSEGDTHPIHLIENRTLGYPDDYKIVLASTPTTKLGSVIHKEFLKGTQHRYFVKCPKCRFSQTLIFEQLRWDKFTSGPDDNRSYDFERMRRGTTYECISCKHQITETEKLKMVDEGEWIQQNPNAPFDTYSFHISVLYSKLKPWGDVAKKFILTVKANDVSEFQDFYNNWLGEVFEERAATVHEDDIDKLCDVFEYNKVLPNGELPVKPAAVLMAADTQGIRKGFWYVICEIGEDRNVYLLEWGQCQTFDDLDHLRRQTYTYQGETVEVAQCLMDSGGDQTPEVYDFCAASEGRFYPAAGSAVFMVGGHEIKAEKTANNGLPYRLYMINDQLYKTKVLLYGLKYKTILRLPKECKHDETIKKHLTSHRRIQKGKNMSWEPFSKSNTPDHLLDCIKYLLAFYDIRRIDIFAYIGGEVTITLDEPETKSAEPAVMHGEWGGGSSWGSSGGGW